MLWVSVLNFKSSFPNALQPPIKSMEWTLYVQTFPQVWDQGALGIKAQLRTWLGHDFKQLTACSVTHPAPRSGKTSKVKLCSPYFPTKFYTGLLKSGCCLLHLCSAKHSWESCLMYFGTTTELLHSHDHSPQGFISKPRQSYSRHFYTQKPSHTLSPPITALSQNYRLAEPGRQLWRSPSPTPSTQSRVSYSRLVRALSSWVLNISTEGDST